MARIFEASAGGVIVYGNRRLPKNSLELEFSADSLKVTVVHKDNLFTAASYTISDLTTILGVAYTKSTLETAYEAMCQ